MSEPLTSKLSSLFIQIDPDDTPEYFGCADLGDLPEPRGDLTPIYCRDRNGVNKIVGSVQGNPAFGTTSITAQVYPETDVIDRLTNCDFTIYAIVANCGKRGIFANYKRVAVGYNARITNVNRQNYVKNEDTALARVVDISYQDVVDIREVTAVRQSIAETLDLNDIVFDMEEKCAGDCGAAKALDSVGFTVSDGSTASPPADADVWITEDKGATWANATSGVPSPFAGGDIVSAVRFAIDKTNTRLLVASGPKAGSAEIAYSDDDGGTWTTVDVGSTDWEGAVGGDALFAFDKDHIWLATDHGRVYKSIDGGVSWTSEASALTESAGASLYGVKFFDYLIGYAFGASDTLIKTVDGGANWTDLTSPTTSDTVTALTVGKDNSNLLWLGSNAGQLWISIDGGTTFTALTYTGQTATDTIAGLDSVNDKVLWMIVNTNAPLGSVHRSINGVSFEKVATPTNAGLNAVAAVDENTAYACGNAQGGTGVVLKISG